MRDAVVLERLPSEVQKGSIAIKGNTEEAMVAKVRVSPEQAAEIARRALPGTVVEIRLDGENGDLIWEAVVVGNNGQVAQLKIDAGNGRLLASEWGPVDLSALATELGGLYADLAEEQDRTLELAIQPDVAVTGNRHLLAQAIGNLLDNALKFTPPGTPLRLEVSDQSARVRVAVSDRGPGIPAEARELVLKRFVRLDAARSTTGSGLGLALVAAVARLHGASLTVGDAGPGLVVWLEFHPAAAV